MTATADEFVERLANPDRLRAFLRPRAATMPRVMLRYAIEKLDKTERDRWLAMRGA